MYTAWYLWKHVAEASSLFPWTIGVVIAYVIGVLLCRDGRTLPGMKRGLIGLIFADLMTEFGWYLAYMEFFPNYEVADRVFRMMPAFVLCPLFFGGSWWLVRMLNRMLRR